MCLFTFLGKINHLIISNNSILGSQEVKRKEDYQRVYETKNLRKGRTTEWWSDYDVRKITLGRHLCYCIRKSVQ